MIEIFRPLCFIWTGKGVTGNGLDLIRQKNGEPAFSLAFFYLCFNISGYEMTRPERDRWSNYFYGDRLL